MTFSILEIHFEKCWKSNMMKIKRHYFAWSCDLWYSLVGVVWIVIVEQDDLTLLVQRPACICLSERNLNSFWFDSNIRKDWMRLKKVKILTFRLIFQISDLFYVFFLLLQSRNSAQLTGLSRPGPAPLNCPPAGAQCFWLACLWSCALCLCISVSSMSPPCLSRRDWHMQSWVYRNCFQWVL